MKKLNEYRAIVCRLGNRAPTEQDTTGNRDYDRGHLGLIWHVVLIAAVK